MKKLIRIFIFFIAVSTLVYSQFVLEQPIIEFDIDFTSDSLGILHYYGYRPTEDEFWLEALTDSIFFIL